MRESPSPRSAPTQAPAPGHSLPLWQLLIHTAEAVAAVQKGRSLTEALEACPSAARPGTQALSFAVMRQLGLAQHLRGLLVPRKPAPWVDALLTTTLALACDASQYTDHTLVDQGVVGVLAGVAGQGQGGGQQGVDPGGRFAGHQQTAQVLGQAQLPHDGKGQGLGARARGGGASLQRLGQGAAFLDGRHGLGGVDQQLPQGQAVAGGRGLGGGRTGGR